MTVNAVNRLKDVEFTNLRNDLKNIDEDESKLEEKIDEYCSIHKKIWKNLVLPKFFAYFVEPKSHFVEQLMAAIRQQDVLNSLNLLFNEME